MQDGGRRSSLAITPPRPLAAVAGPLLTAAGFYGTAAATLGLMRGPNGIAVLWPANAILLAALLIAPRRAAWRHVAAAAVASFLVNLHLRVSPGVSLGYTLANVLEALGAWWLVRGPDRSLPSFETPAKVARFFLAAWAAALGSASLATLFDLSRALDAWSSWVTTDLLGMLVVTPLLVTGCAWWRATRARGRAWRLRAVATVTAALVGVAAVASIGFTHTDYPLLFLSVAAMLAATLGFGPFGAAASVAVIAVVGAACTGAGLGPLAIVAGTAHAVLFLQFYLLVLLAIALPMAALFTARERLIRQLGESNRLLHLAERSAGLGHWRIATDLDCHWSPEALRILWLAGQPGVEEVLARYHPDDRKRVAAAVRHALANATSFEIEARLLAPDGEERRVLSRGTANRGPDGRVRGLFGTIQDVTRQARGHDALEAARHAAEQAALLAIAAAETDPLTGVANRRKVAMLLEREIVAATAARRPLSVAMLDLDHFKAINDRHGHLVGDEVLVGVARRAAATLRGGDVVGRIGGEEFVLILPHADADQAAAVAERVRQAIALAPADDRPAVTASVGVATWQPGEGAAALLGRADQALYAAKRAGRNLLRRAA